MSDKLFGCPQCGLASSVYQWRLHTSTVVGGMGSPLTVSGDPSREEDRDPNFFYICPQCENEIRGNELVDESMLDFPHPDDIEEEVPTESCTVTLGITLDIEPGESRESILRRVMTILEESNTYNLDAIFDSVNVEGIDY